LYAAVHRPQSGSVDVELFPSLFEKAAALAHAIATGHPFVEGNKRTGFLAAALMLKKNGFDLGVGRAAGTEAMLRVVCGQMTLEALAEWLRDNARPPLAGSSGESWHSDLLGQMGYAVGPLCLHRATPPARVCACSTEFPVSTQVHRDTWPPSASRFVLDL
jgi:death-on-curing protein